MYAKFLGIEIFIEIGDWRQTLFEKPILIKHNEVGTYEVRILGAILVTSIAKRKSKNDTHCKTHTLNK
jgi:hypothetical protein